MSRRSLVLLALALTVLPAWAGDYPNRKPGLWELTTRDDAGAPPQVMQQCIDAASDQSLQKLGQGMAQQMCQDVKTRREGDKFIVETTCAMTPQSKMVSRSVMSGNYQSSYREESETRFEPPMAGMKSVRSKVEARWLGACKPGQKPGDVVMPDGKTVNLTGLPQGPRPAPRK